MKIKNIIRKFNDYLADRLSYILSIMATFYVVLLLVLFPLMYSQPTSIVAWASYICSVIFQGIALPVLGYTSRKASDQTDALMKKMFEMTKHIEVLTEQISNQQKHIHEEIGEILDIEKEEIEKGV